MRGETVKSGWEKGGRSKIVREGRERGENGEKGGEEEQREKWRGERTKKYNVHIIKALILTDCI